MNSAALIDAVVPHLGAIAGLVLGSMLVAHTLSQRRAPQATLAWILAIVLIPYVGVPLYLVFGGRKLSRDAPQNSIDRLRDQQLSADFEAGIDALRILHRDLQVRIFHLLRERRRRGRGTASSSSSPARKPIARR